MHYLKMLIDNRPEACVFISFSILAWVIIFSILAWVILFSIFCRRDKEQYQQDNLVIAQQEDFE